MSNCIKISTILGNIKSVKRPVLQREKVCVIGIDK